MSADSYNFIHLSRNWPDALVAPSKLVLIVKNERNGVKSILTFNTDRTVDTRPEGMSEEEASRLSSEFLGVHVRHCCSAHGCKYGQHDECPVARELLEQEDECETCWDAKEGDNEVKTAVVAWLREVADDADAQNLLFNVSQTVAIRACAHMLENHDAWRKHLPTQEGSS